MKEIRTSAEEAIYRLISDITISMKGSDFLSLPKKVMNEVPVQMSESEKQNYQTMKEEMVLSLKDGEIDAANAAALSGKLLQMANGAVYDDNHCGIIRPGVGLQCSAHQAESSRPDG